MSSYDLERSKQESAEIRKAFREIFPLASEHDLPWAACHIKEFLKGRVEQEVVEGTTHYTLRVSQILCEVTRPKTHIEDMCRIVVEEVKRARDDVKKLEAAVQVTVERDEMLARLSEIGRIVGCGHIGDPDGRQKLVSCVRETIEAKDDIIRNVGQANIASWVMQALGVDGAHHKQFYLCKIATALNIELPPGIEEGISP